MRETAESDERWRPKMNRRHSVALTGALGLVGALLAMMPASAEEPTAAELTWAACPGLWLAFGGDGG
jgi:hypothetical protein